MIFNGIIKVNKKNNYAYFSIDTATVRKELKEPFIELRKSMKDRGICGSLYAVSANLKLVHIVPKHVHIGHVLVQTTPKMG